MQFILVTFFSGNENTDCVVLNSVNSLEIGQFEAIGVGTFFVRAAEYRGSDEGLLSSRATRVQAL